MDGLADWRQLSSDSNDEAVPATQDEVLAIVTVTAMLIFNNN
jgi:hypothetical protein